MAGYLGDDFDPDSPEDSDLVRNGARWIRDIKGRLKRFAFFMFDPETGYFRNSVIRHASLKDSGVKANTYSKVQVNAKGLVTAGDNPVDQQVSRYFRAVFYATGSYFYETSDSLVSGNGTQDTVYVGTAPYIGGENAPFTPNPSGGYGIDPTGSDNYRQFTFTPPVGVRRVKAFIVGGGGGAYKVASNDFASGGSSDAVETVFTLDGSGTQALTIIVGKAGTNGESALGKDGCPSRVALTNEVYADAGCGKAAPAHDTGGDAIAGQSADAILGVIRSAGTDGQSLGDSYSGSLWTAFGCGGSWSIDPGDGIVVLEWVL